MAVDIFKFWSQVGLAEKVHPADRPVFERVKAKEGGFDLRCLPFSFFGPLKTAKVVLLYLSPGLSEDDIAMARSIRSQRLIREMRQGGQPMFSQEDHPAAAKWWRRQTRGFGIEEGLVRGGVAIMDIGAYHSSSFVDHELLAALPSSRVSLAWAQDILFPEAVAGKRVVICLRSARFWGLQPGKRYGKNLFAPKVTRGGHMLKGPMRNAAIRAVRKALGVSI